jgi:hypothetical protein
VPRGLQVSDGADCGATIGFDNEYTHCHASYRLCRR